MTQDTNDPWATRAMDDFGAQLLALEDRAPARTRRRRAAVAIAAATPIAAAGAIAVILLVGPGHPHPKAAPQAQLPLVSGGPLQPVPAATVVNRAAQAAISAGTVRYHSTTRITVEGRAVPGVSALGAISFKHRGYRATITNAASKIAIDRIATNGTLYARAAPAGRAQTPWVALARPTKDLSSSAAIPGSETLTDPPALLQAMATATGQPRPAGDATIDGAATTAYRVSTQLRQFIPTTPLPGGVAREPVDLIVWTDRAGRPRRVSATFANRSRDATLTTQTHFYDYATTVRVSTPTADVVHARSSSDLPDSLDPAVTKIFLSEAP